MKALFASPQWKDMPFEVQYAARKWFKKAAMKEDEQAQLDAAAPKLVFKDLAALSDESDVASTVKALEAAIAGLRNAPAKIEVTGLDQLATISHEVFTDPKVMELILKIIDHRPGTNGVFLKRVYAVVQKTKDSHQLQRTSSYLWPYIASVEPRSLYEPMKKFIAALIKTDPEAASTLARGGLRALTSARNSYGFSPSQHVGGMQTLVGQVAMELGLVVIPVPKNHPAYAVYLSQGEWIKGNEDSAGILIDENAEQLLEVYRKLSQPFLSGLCSAPFTAVTRNDKSVWSRHCWNGSKKGPPLPLRKRSISRSPTGILPCSATRSVKLWKSSPVLARTRLTKRPWPSTTQLFGKSGQNGSPRILMALSKPSPT